MDFDNNNNHLEIICSAMQLSIPAEISSAPGKGGSIWLLPPGAPCTMGLDVLLRPLLICSLSLFYTKEREIADAEAVERK